MFIRYAVVIMEEKKSLPILVLKCKECGKPFMAHALAYPMTEDIAKLVAEAVRNGDEPVICTEVTFGCTCDKTYLDEEDE